MRISGVRRQELEAAVDVGAVLPTCSAMLSALSRWRSIKAWKPFGLFDGMHVGALQVLGDLRAACFLVGHGADHARRGGQAGDRGATEAAVAKDDFRGLRSSPRLL